MTKSLTQVIVNTQGYARTVRQNRNEKGQFTGKALVSVLTMPTHVLHTAAAEQAAAVVIVSHHYQGFNQTVMSVNRDTGKGNAVTFINDGSISSPALHDSIYGGK